MPIGDNTARDEALDRINASTLKDRANLPRRFASMHDRRTTAHHECGHVMAAFVGGAAQIEVRIRDDATGICIARTVEDPEAGITYSLAGAFAEVKFNPPRIHSYTSGPCADLLISRMRIDQLNAGRTWPQLTYRTAAKTAMRFVDTHWHAIQDLALALDDARELDDMAIRIFATCRS